MSSLGEPALEASALEALYEISLLAAGGRNDPATVARVAGEHARRLLDFEAAAVFAWSEAGGLLEAVYQTPGAALNPAAAHGLAADVFQTTRPLAVGGFQSLAGRLAPAAARAIRSAICVPMLLHGRAVGVLAVWACTVRRIEERDLQLLSLFAGQIAPAFQAARSFSRTKQRRDALQALQDVALGLAGVKDPLEVARLSARIAADLLQADAACLLAYDSERDLLVPLAQHGATGDPEWTVRPGEGASGLAFATREVVVAADYATWDGAVQEVVAGGVRSAIAAPLVVRDRALGALLVGWRSPHRFSARERELLSLFGSLIAPDLEASQLIERSAEQVRDLEALQKIAVAASGLLDPEVLAQLTVDTARDLLGVDSAALRWWQPETGTLRLLATNDVTGAEHDLEVPAGQGVIGIAFQTGSVVSVDDYGRAENNLAQELAPGVRTTLAVPLLAGSRAVGALAVWTYDEHRYDLRARRLLTSFAALVGPAMEAARLSAARNEDVAALRRINELAAAIAGLLDPRAIARLVTGAARQLTGADSSVLALLSGDELAVLADDDGARRLEMGQGAIGRAIQLGAPQVVPDYAAWPHAEADAIARGYRSMAALPMPVEGRVVGAIAVGFRERRELSEDDVRRLQLLAAQAAPALEAAQLHARLASSQDELRRIYAAMACGVVVWDGEGRIIEISDTGLQLFGITRAELDGRMPAEIAGYERVTDEGAAMAWNERPMLRALRSGEPVRSAVVGYRKRDGEVIWLQFDCVPLLDAGGRVQRVIGSFIDIGAVKRAEAARRESEAKSRFLASMSHELRTPLNSILGFTQLLQSEAFGALNQRQERYVGHIAASGQHLLQLVNDVLDLSKVAAGQMDFGLETVDVDQVLEEVIGGLRPLAASRGIALRRRHVAAVRVRADGRRMRQVLHNLVANAIKFTDPGGRVEVEVRRRRREVLVAVHDTGIGIPPDQRERIFQEFTQVDDTRRRSSQGTGLGLPLTRSLVERMGGRLWLESEVGKGSSFYFSLPRTS